MPLKKLTAFADTLNVTDIASIVINNPSFAIWSGAGKHDQHHYGKGGLAIHTCEVVELCLKNREILSLTQLDPVELYLSALFHDVGKMWDYAQKSSGPVDAWNPSDEWISTDHKYKIHHITRSVIEWNAACYTYPRYKPYVDKVTHNILAHHGQRAWGSPVIPDTKSAWLLHICDMMSARMQDGDDCNKHSRT